MGQAFSLLNMNFYDDALEMCCVKGTPGFLLAVFGHFIGKSSRYHFKILFMIFLA